MPRTDTPYLDAVPDFMHGHRKKAVFFISRLRRLAAGLKLPHDKMRVLEFGCGNGQNVSLPVAEQGFRVTGVDLHRPSIEYAKRSSTLPNADFICGDCHQFQSVEKFQAVILSDILEHVPRPAELLRQSRKHLAPGGILLISVPNGRGPYEIEQLLIEKGILKPPLELTRRLVAAAVRTKHRLRKTPLASAGAPSLPAYNLDSGHVQFFSGKGLRHLVEGSKLRIDLWRNGCLMGGDWSYFLFYFLPRLTPLSLKVADKVPHGLASTWLLECRAA